MGFDLGWRGWATRPDPSVDLTVVTLNMAGRVASEGPAGLMAEWNADVAALQECGYAFQRNLSRQGLEGWHVATGPTQCLLSRFEILERRTMERETLEAAGGSGLVASYLLAGPTGPFWLTSIHLETPRDGLSLIRYGQPIEGIRVLGQSARLRRIEHRQARRFVDALSGPRITVGDFNTPPESRYYREAWGDWTNAFSFAGFGFGGTRLSGWIRARIDHLVVDEAWEVVEARVGEHVGSDHLPVIAVLRPR
jgi:endonuclease/exonuclease/phosphatase (EEP) superfamily protein YafD